MNSKPICIVGGGLAGLAAAAHIARDGQRAIVFERAQTAGGRARTTAVAAGSSGTEYFSMNFGPHALYAKGPAVAILRELGIEVPGGVTPKRGIVGGVEETLCPLPTGPLSLLATKLLRTGEKWAFARTLAALAETPTGTAAQVSLSAWLEPRHLPARVVALVHAIARLTTYANAPERIPAALIGRQLRKASGGVLYADRGWGSIVESLSNYAIQRGATIRSDAKVTAVAEQGGAHTLTLATGEEIEAAAIVLAVAPEVVSSLTGGQVHHSLTKVQAACLDVALTNIDARRPWFSLGIDRATYLSVHSVCAKLAPPGGAVVHVARYLAPGEAADGATEALLEHELDLVHPGWRANVASRRFLPHITVSNALRDVRQALPNEDGVERPGLFLAGDWVRNDEALVDAVFTSAKRAAALAVSYAR